MWSSSACSCRCHSVSANLTHSYFWIPNFLFSALSTFNWINWIAPNNVQLSLVTGFNNGLGRWYSLP